MNVYTCTDHDGYWPVGAASIVVAENEEEARTLLREKLVSMDLDPDGFTLQVLDTSTPKAVVLRDGDY